MFTEKNQWPVLTSAFDLNSISGGVCTTCWIPPECFLCKPDPLFWVQETPEPLLQ